jgi:hypothetical protein
MSADEEQTVRDILLPYSTSLEQNDKEFIAHS